MRSMEIETFVGRACGQASNVSIVPRLTRASCKVAESQQQKSVLQRNAASTFLDDVQLQNSTVQYSGGNNYKTPPTFGQGR